VREPGEWKFQPLSEVRSADCPIFFAFAEEDPWIPKRDIPLLEQNIAEAKRQCKVKTYAGTKSGFSSGFYNPKSPHYSKKLAEECWGDATAFLEQHLK
jgi:dienelactone hydrolase